MLTHNGKPYARVSEVLQPFTNFDGISQETLERKAAIGTRIHQAVQDDIEGNFPIIVPQELGYFNSFEQWRAAMNPVFVKTEMRHYCEKKMLTGCIDALVKLEGEEKAILVDWKTSVSESPTWVMQAHLYGYLLTDAGEEIAPRYLFVKLDKSGKMPKVFEYKFNSSMLSRCLQAVDDFWKNVAINSQ
jgi:ATP-dependent exoDNAse (exonuclease V) beta subunit